MEDETQKMLHKPAGNEVRFVMNTGEATVVLENDGPEPGYVTVFFGDFQGETHEISEQLTLHIEMPEHLKALKNYPYQFHHQVVRLIFFGGHLYLRELNGDLRKPMKEELPEKTLVFYGTSITHGKHATHSSLTYPKLTTRMLGCDCINIGVSGTAVLEEAMSEYLASIDADGYVLCLSVNMFNLGFDTEEFIKRAEYMLDTLTAKRPDCKVYCISIINSYHDQGIVKPLATPCTTVESYRKALKELVLRYEQVRYVDGAGLLSITGLSYDLLHPGNYGMIEIASKLERIIEDDN